MGGSRIRGPHGASGPFRSELPCRGTSEAGRGKRNRPGSRKHRELTAEEREALLDCAQLALDLIGIFEPTPFADGTNMIISLTRSDYLGAAASGLSLIPYFGDLAKLAKIPKYTSKVTRALKLARQDAELARVLRPILERIRPLLEKVPLSKVPRDVAAAIERIKGAIDTFLPSARVASKLDHLVDVLLTARMGSVKNVGDLVRSNVRTAAKYFVEHGLSVDKMKEVLSGIDVHKPLSIETLKKGDLVAQWMGKNVGEWFIGARGAVSHRNLGLAEGSRSRKLFRVKTDVSVLKSKAAPMTDTWTHGRAAPREMVSGGGDQYFLPHGSQFVEELPP